jgi:tetratricopeptide (TPR) repeat protein
MNKNPPPDEQPSFDTYFKEGTALLHRGKATEATSLLEKANRLEPEHVDAAINLSGAYILTGKFTWAVSLLEDLSRREPKNTMVWINLGAAYLGNPVLATGEQQLQAILAFERALELDPLAPNVAYNLGLIYRDRKETEQAIHWFERAAQANPHDEDARRILERLRQGQ